jgi:hypothetical protein
MVMRVWHLVFLLVSGVLAMGAVPNPDVCPDGMVNAVDLAGLADYLAGNHTPAVAAERSDLSGDGQLRVNDLVELQLILAGTPVRNYVLLHREADPPATPLSGSVTVTLTVGHYGVDAIRGFCLTDYVPPALELTAYSVWLDGVELPDVLAETGLPGGIHAGTVARRWVLEQPPDFVTDQPLSPGATLVVVMELVTESAGSYDLTECSWIGSCPDGEGPVFGPGDDALSVTLVFVE